MNEIIVNGEPCPAAPGTTVRDVVMSVTADATGCAVALNDAVVPRSTWPERTVEPGDRVEVLTAVQGG
jgi:sulfur carrier protein